MAQKLKNLTMDDIEITLWETGSISFSSSKNLDYDTVDEFLSENQIETELNFRNFIDSINPLIMPNKKQTFVYIPNPTDDQSYIDYLSNSGIIRCYTNECRADLLINPRTPPEQLLRALQKVNISSGLDKSSVNNLLKKPVAEYVTIARGKPFVNPIPRQYKYNYLTERPMPINLKQKNKVSFLDLTVENRTIQNAVLASFIDAIPGENGQSISSHIIPSPALAQQEVILTDSVYEKDNTIYAKESGTIAFDKHVISVVPTTTISRPIANQRLNIDGSLVVQTKVSNSHIDASNDIVIYGSVNDCTITCGGFIYLLGGMAGSMCRVDAGQDVFSPFCYNGFINSRGGNITIAYESINAQLKAKGYISVDRKACGGKLESLSGIKVHIAGSERVSSPTILQLTTNIEERNKLLEYRRRINDHEQQLRATIINKRKYEVKNSHLKQGLAKDPEYLKLLKTEKHLTADLQTARANYDNLANSQQKASITVYGNIWRGVVVNIDDNQMLIKDDSYPSIFVMGEFGILRRRYD